MNFWKYQGAGNDFVMVDQRSQKWLTRADQTLIAQLCDRRFGIGADGLILLELCNGYDFEMIYFNADGRESTMCGNGGRCIAAFAHHLGIVDQHCTFLAIDGPHEAIIMPPPNQDNAADLRWVELHMKDVDLVENQDQAFVLNTGSPHYVRFVENLDNIDMVAEGRAVRYSDRWKKEGINVNLCSASAGKHEFSIRTYERGVEDETLACGTGVTAAAISAFIRQNEPFGEFETAVHAKGGDLSVRFTAHPNGRFSNIWLCGPAMRVFEGSIEI
ncbi:MAG: diaminopimelate epimerase [Saprospiraceae bacterium]|nr:diaminopimelate epimerase [Saprospiraceae bacterium]